MAYSAKTAVSMGLTAGVVTSSSPGYPFETLLPSADLVNVPADATTTFEYSLSDGVRTQWLTSRASDITREDVPDSWATARVVLLGPVANELPLDAADWFSDDSFVCAVPQGWQRSRDTTGMVVVSPDVPDGLFERIDAVVVSEADVPSFRVQAWTETFPIVVVTRGRRGARMYADGRLLDVAPVTCHPKSTPQVQEMCGPPRLPSDSSRRTTSRLRPTSHRLLRQCPSNTAAMRGVPTRDQVIARMGVAS